MSDNTDPPIGEEDTEEIMRNAPPVVASKEPEARIEKVVRLWWESEELDIDDLIHFINEEMSVALTEPVESEPEARITERCSCGVVHTPPCEFAAEPKGARSVLERALKDSTELLRALPPEAWGKYAGALDTQIDQNFAALASREYPR